MVAVSGFGLGLLTCASTETSLLTRMVLVGTSGETLTSAWIEVFLTPDWSQTVAPPRLSSDSQSRV